MVDNRYDTRRSMRTPLARAKGLGPAGHGAGHWWIHRLTAVSNIPLVIAFVIVVASLAGRTYEEAILIVSHPLISILLILAVISVTNHMRLGMQIIIEDYVHGEGGKLALLVLNTFFCAVLGAVAVFSILKIAVGG